MAAVAVASLLLAGALVVEARSVLLFHSVAPWSSPDRIQFCGRDYHRGGAVSATAAEDVTGTSPFRQLARGPLWQPVADVVLRLLEDAPKTCAPLEDERGRS